MISRKSTKQTFVSNPLTTLKSLHCMRQVENVYDKGLLSIISRVPVNYLSVWATQQLVYEDNIACITKLQRTYIKGDMTKHIPLKFSFPHELQQNKNIKILTLSNYAPQDNFINVLIKAPPRFFRNKIIHFLLL